MIFKNNMEESNLIKRMGNTGLYVVGGDITQIPTDAIMTAINSGGLWFGGIDSAIQKVAGNHYHAQAGANMPLSDLQSLVAKGDKANHRGQFNDVVFVVDDLKSPLELIIYQGLETANQEGYHKLLLPAVRMGVMAGVVEKTSEEAILRIKNGINAFMGKYGKTTKLEDITFVIYGNTETAKKLSSGLKDIENSKN
jgi:O-acetyl-ADP-ribose deacetylase (regulator of RNase III)